MEDNSNPDSNSNPQPQESQPDLLYFFLSRDSLISLYKTLFTDNKIDMPFLIYSTNNGNIENTESYTIIDDLVLLNKSNTPYPRKIFDINIKVEDGLLRYFKNEIMYATKNDDIKRNDDDYNNEVTAHKKYIVSQNDMLFNYGDIGSIVYDKEISVKKKDLEKLQKALKIGYIENCNVICRFFLVDKLNYHFVDNKRIQKEMSNNVNAYYKQFEKDENKIKKIYIANDMIFDAYTDKNNDYINCYTTKFLKTIFLKTDSSKRPEIILLPCLHKDKVLNYFDNKGSINPLCKSFTVKVNNVDEKIQINTKIYTDFYGIDKVSKTNNGRQHCHDNTFIGIALKHYVIDNGTNGNYSIINRIDDDANTDNNIRTEYDNTQGGRRKSTKRSKKTKKPKKRSRKTRKHKKSRKH